MKILVAVLALGLAFWGYAFVYRGKTEPPAKYPVTNQDAAVYSLRGQIQMLSQQEELNTFAFEVHLFIAFGILFAGCTKLFPLCKGKTVREHGI